MLGATEEDSFTKINKMYTLLLKNLREVAAQEGDHPSESTVGLIRSIDQAMETIKEYRQNHGNTYEKIEV